MLIFFHLTNGAAEKFVEDKLNDQLKYNGDLRVYLMAGGASCKGYRKQWN